jgi:hypothetical protein
MFWSDVNIDPKRSFRWLFHLPNIIHPYLVRSVKKPSFSVGNIAHQFVNHTFYYPGRVNWNPVDVTLVDPAGGGDSANAVGDDTSMTLLKAIYDSGYQDPSKDGAEGMYSSISKFRSTAVLGTPIIEQIDGFGRTVEEWTLHNAWCENVDFGSLDYGSEEMISVSMTIRYDWASLST